MNSLHYKNLPSNSVLCLMAPTASGKTDLAFRLYETGRFSLISVDSALVYRGMDIGTAKPSPEQLRRYPHALVDIILPTQSYSVAAFVKDCQELIAQSHQAGKIALLVGGTMLYYSALLQGLSALPATDEAVRAQVALWHNEQGNRFLHEYLQQHDPAIAARLNENDSQRLMRAVEVHLQTGVPLSVHQQTPKTALCHNPDQVWYALGVLPERSWLHERIAKRLEMMWQAGFVDEVKELLVRYPNLDAMPAMRAVGYRQVCNYLQAVASLDPKNPENLTKMACQAMKNEALYATRQLAKRQCTWLRSLSVNAAPTEQHTTRTNFALFTSIEEVQKRLL